MSGAFDQTNLQNLVRYQHEQLVRFGANLGKALSTEDVDAVHDLRVASRRLHDALDVMDLGSVEGGGAVQASLKRIRKGFRRVRDLDVLRISLRECADTELPGRKRLAKWTGFCHGDANGFFSGLGASPGAAG